MADIFHVVMSLYVPTGLATLQRIWGISHGRLAAHFAACPSPGLFVGFLDVHSQQPGARYDISLQFLDRMCRIDVLDFYEHRLLCADFWLYQADWPR